ncbi:MAG: hypothetical protein HQ481_16940 [Alphaproteobacteria bacterium]|nr:hypothetical protein [Alphaproteobacteria bacterium]
MRSDFDTQIERLYADGDMPPRAVELTPELIQHSTNRGRVLQSRETQRLLRLALSSLRGVVSTIVASIADAARFVRRPHPSKG